MLIDQVEILSSVSRFIACQPFFIRPQPLHEILFVFIILADGLFYFRTEKERGTEAVANRRSDHQTVFGEWRVESEVLFSGVSTIHRLRHSMQPQDGVLVSTEIHALF